MHPYTYRIRFLLIHPNLDFTKTRDVLRNVLGLNPHRLMNFGNDRVSPLGAKLEGTYFDSRWSFDFHTTDEWEKSEIKSAPEEITDIIEKLTPHKQVFTELANQGCRTEVIITIGVDSNTSEAFTPYLMRRLSDFDISLAIDLYPPDA